MITADANATAEKFARASVTAGSQAVEAYRAAIDEPRNSFIKNRSETARWQYTLQAHHHLRATEDAAALAAGQAHRDSAGPAAWRASSLAAEGIALAREARDILEQIDREEARAERAERREHDRLRAADADLAEAEMHRDLGD